MNQQGSSAFHSHDGAYTKQGGAAPENAQLCEYTVEVRYIIVLFVKEQNKDTPRRKVIAMPAKIQ